MRLFKRVGITLAVGALLGFVPSTVEAVTIVPGDAFCTSNDQGGNDTIFLAGCGVTGVSLLYNAEPGGGDGGSFAGSYSTVFSNTAQDPSDATITYDGAPDPTITCPSCYALVKDGNFEPAKYLINLGSWNGTDPLEFVGFWPDGGAISHVSIWGSRDDYGRADDDRRTDDDGRTYHDRHGSRADQHSAAWHGPGRRWPPPAPQEGLVLSTNWRAESSDSARNFLFIPVATSPPALECGPQVLNVRLPLGRFRSSRVPHLCADRWRTAPPRGDATGRPTAKLPTKRPFRPTHTRPGFRGRPVH